MMTFDEGRISTWRLPRFCALWIDRRASFRTLMRTIVRAFNREVLLGFLDQFRAFDGLQRDDSVGFGKASTR